MDPECDWEMDGHLWNPHAIIKHKNENPVQIKILWSDLTTTWEDMNAVFLHHPKLVTTYGIKQNILHNPGWSTVKQYLRLGSTIPKSVLKTTTDFAPVFKFGVQVPRNHNEALQLDHKNGNTKWQNAIKLEIKGINEYSTF